MGECAMFYGSIKYCYQLFFFVTAYYDNALRFEIELIE